MNNLPRAESALHWAGKPPGDGELAGTMFFSGITRLFRCSRCGYETSRSQSHAISNGLVLLAVGCWVIFPVIKRRFGHHFNGLEAIGAEVALLALLVAVMTWWTSRQATAANLKCPKCSAPLVKTGFGFYDRLFPAWDDILVGLGFWIANAVAIVLLLRK